MANNQPVPYLMDALASHRGNEAMLSTCKGWPAKSAAARTRYERWRADAEACGLREGIYDTDEDYDEEDCRKFYQDFDW